jgi:hypothetical protein
MSDITTDYMAIFEPDPEPAQAPALPPKAKPPRAPSGDRRVERAVAVCRLSRPQRELLAKAAGIRGYDDSDAAVVRLVGTCHKAAKVVGRVLAIAEADPLEAGVLAAELAPDREEKAAAWAVAGGEGPVPRAAELAKACKALAPGTLHDLRTIAEALR